MTKTSILTTACTVLYLASGAFFSASQAASNTSFMQGCSTQWKAMKTAGTVPAGQKWSDFLKTCTASAPVATAAPVVPAANKAKLVAAAPIAPATTATTTPTSVVKKVLTPAAKTATTLTPISTSKGMFAEQSRIKECGAEWKTAKASNKILAGQTWPQFWSACDARLKG
jgi:hypothetical protein